MRPVSVFMAGSPGAGKTEAAKEIIAQLEARAGAPKVLRIDPDDLRAEFHGCTGGDSWLFQRAASIGLTGCMTSHWIRARVSSSTARSPTLTVRGSQARFDQFISTFNQERPHEALNMRYPAAGRALQPFPAYL